MVRYIPFMEKQRHFINMYIYYIHVYQTTKWVCGAQWSKAGNLQWVNSVVDPPSSIIQYPARNPITSPVLKYFYIFYLWFPLDSHKYLPWNLNSFHVFATWIHQTDLEGRGGQRQLFGHLHRLTRAPWFISRQIHNMSIGIGQNWVPQISNICRRLILNIY